MNYAIELCPGLIDDRGHRLHADAKITNYFYPGASLPLSIG
jgi:hypothetical protein